MNVLLAPLELTWRGVNRLRRALYRHGLLRPRVLPRVVISVGNLTAGGAGKTPTVITLVKELSARGYRVAVLTRGYGRSDGAMDGVITELDALRFGDEPVLIAASVPEIAVIVGSRRFENAVQYLTRNDCDLFLLDDGFQHLQLARDIDVVIDVTAARWQREGRSALRDATFVLRRGTALHEGEFSASLQPVALRQRGETLPLELLRGARVGAFAGLANNRQFFVTVAACGAQLVWTREFRDHHRYSAAEVSALLSEAAAAGATRVITTEKDAVKLPHDAIMPIAALVSEMKIEPAEPFYDTLVQRIEDAKRRRKLP